LLRNRRRYPADLQRSSDLCARRRRLGDDLFGGWRVMSGMPVSRGEAGTRKDPMKFHSPAPGHRLMTVGLLSIVGLLLAVAPAQAARKHRSKARPPHLSQHEKVEATRVCVESYAAAQGPRKSGQLIEAKDLFGKCAQPACGSSLRKRCAALYKRMDAGIPSVLLVVTDASGVSQSMNEGKFEVTMDGQSVTAKLDGRAIPVNPGQHEFAFSTENAVFATQTVAIVHGQRNRAISVTLPAAKTIGERAATIEAPGQPAQASDEPLTRLAGRPPERDLESTRGGPSKSVYVLAGVGALGLGSAALLTYWGRKDNTALMQSCGTNCRPSSVHHIRTLYLASDIALGVGVVALAASTWLYLRSSGSEEKTSTRGARVSLFDVQTTPSGAFAAIQGVF
jgi:hypothetical protein